MALLFSFQSHLSNGAAPKLAAEQRLNKKSVAEETAK